MYKKTDPQQSLFGVETQLTASLKKRLENSWAYLFRSEILSILLDSEDQFSALYGKTGRPNFSVARMLGICFLQEINNLDDQRSLDSLGFDIRWRYALGIDDQDAYLSRRSLVEFRRRLVEHDPEMEALRGIFGKIGNRAIQKISLSTSEQRTDSTHIVSNIRTNGRVDLFQKTIRHFIKSLDPKRFPRVPESVKDWYQREKEGWFGVGNTQHLVKLAQLAEYLSDLIAIFKNDQEIFTTEPYQLLVRLFNEHCQIVNSDDKNQSNNSSEKQIKIKRANKGETLQSPYDPEASYGHKGRGYSVHITETCNNKVKPEIITDYEVHGAAFSDKGKASGILDRLESADLKPKTLYADGGYPTPPSALNVINNDVEFMAPVDRSRLPDNIMGRDQFEFDESGRVTRCPQKHKPLDHRLRSSNNRKGKSMHAIFDGDICRSCSQLTQCSVRAPNNRKAGTSPRHTRGNFRLEVTQKLRLRDQMYADQQTDSWKERYKIRSGVEATMSELKRSHGMGKLRVRRLSKVCFAIACKVIACNIKRWTKAHGNVVDLLYLILSDVWGDLGPIRANNEKFTLVQEG